MSFGSQLRYYLLRGLSDTPTPRNLLYHISFTSLTALSEYLVHLSINLFYWLAVKLRLCQNRNLYVLLTTVFLVDVGHNYLNI